MSADRWSQLAALFEAASALPPGERAAWLERACPEHELREELQSLLEAAVDGPTFFDRPAIPRSDDALEEEATLAGLRLGPWRLRHALGEGGMGTVWLAERVDGQFEQLVAVKLMQPQLDSPAIRERFEWERRIQARLDHPNVCRLLDAGTTADGQPYLVLPFIDQARPITVHADELGLNLRQRIELFNDVCAAIQSAHQNLVVHGDIKPGNILVGRTGQVQLVDFGIARLLTAGPELGLRLGLTPGYASPELLAGDAPNTLSDIYALGVLLKRLTEQVPSGRHRGDLQAVINRATAADAAARYATAEALADELGNMLADRPVSARGGGGWYLLNRFARRNRWPLGGLGLIFGALCAVIGVMAVMNTRIVEQAERAAMARDHAEAAAEFWARLFEDMDPIRSRETSRDVDELLDRAVAELKDRSPLAPEIRARLLGVIGTAYWNLAQVQSARATAEASIALLDSSNGPAGARAMAYHQLANFSVELADLDTARDAANQARHWADRAPELSIIDQTRVLTSEALVLGEIGQPLAAAERIEEVIRLRSQLPLDEVIVDQATAHGNLGYMYFQHSRSVDDPEPWLARAEQHVRSSLELLYQHFGAEHPRLGFMYNAAGRLSQARGDLDQALLDFQRAEAVLRPGLPPGHGLLVDLQLYVGDIHLTRNQAEQAEAAFEGAHAAAVLGLPIEHPSHRAALRGLTRARLARGDRVAARNALDRMITELPAPAPDSIDQLWQELLAIKLADPSQAAGLGERIAASGNSELMAALGRMTGAAPLP